MKETFAQAAERHQALATSVMAEAESDWIKTNALSRFEGRLMFDQAIYLRSRSRSLQRAASLLPTVEGRWPSDNGGTFVGLNLTSLDWSSLCLTAGTFEGCNFVGVNFSQVVLGATFIECYFTGATFDHCSVGGRFDRCTFSNATFTQTNVWGFRAFSCYMEGVKFCDTYRRKPYRYWNGTINDGLVDCTGTFTGLEDIEWGDVA